MKLSGTAAAAVLCACASTIVFAQKPPKADQKAEAATADQQQNISAAMCFGDMAMAGQTTPTDFPIHFQNDFLRAQGGRVWVPMILTLDKAQAGAQETMYVRVAPRGATVPPPPVCPPPPPDKKGDKNKKDVKKGPPAAAPTYPYEDVALLDLKSAAPDQPVRILRGIGVPPGSYDLYVVLRERGGSSGAPAKVSVLKQPLEVPNYGNGEFATSSVILAERVEQLPAPLPPDQQSEHPYAFGTSEIVVSPDHKFRKSQELIVLLQIYNPSYTADKKFNLEAAYTFYRQEAGGEKRFNSTEPQALTPETMGAGFDPSGSAAIQAGQAIPLQSFPEGTYRLEIKITDKLNAKALTQNVNFTVTP